MSDTFKKGDKVTWDSAGGQSRGTVVKKVITETKVKSHVAKASTDDPQYLVKSENQEKKQFINLVN